MLISFIAEAQELNKLTGVVLNMYSKAPLPEVPIYIDETGDTLYTDEQGYFEVNAPFRHLHYVIDLEGYRQENLHQRFDSAQAYRVIYLIPSDSSESHPIEDPAHYEHIGQGTVFSTPYPEQGFGTTDFSFALEWEMMFSTRTRISRFNQLGADVVPFKFAWYGLRGEQSINPEQHFRERYFAYYVSAYLYDRWIITQRKKTTGAKGLFLDIGIGYELPLAYRYVYKTDFNNKHVTTYIHRYNEVTAMARFGFDVLSIRATYRLFDDILIGNFTEPARLKIGLDMNVSAFY